LIHRFTRIATAFIIQIGDHIKEKPVVNKQFVVINQAENVRPQPILQIHPVLHINPLDATPTEAVLNLIKLKGNYSKKIQQPYIERRGILVGSWSIIIDDKLRDLFNTLI